jgi:hypothetical protein
MGLRAQWLCLDNGKVRVTSPDGLTSPNDTPPTSDSYALQIQCAKWNETGKVDVWAGIRIVINKNRDWLHIICGQSRFLFLKLMAVSFLQTMTPSPSTVRMKCPRSQRTSPPRVAPAPPPRRSTDTAPGHNQSAQLLNSSYSHFSE